MKASIRSCLALAVLVLGPSAACSTSSPSASPGYPPGPYGVNAGEIIENIQLTTLEGTPYELKSIHQAGTQGSARAAVLYVTATWCFSCRPAVDWINQKVASSGGSVVAVAVVLEDKQYQPADVATGREFAEGYGVKFPTMIDPARQLDKYRASGVIPLTVIIDPAAMRITYREFGFNASTVEREVAKLTAPGEGVR